jgi:hypothetical protein
LRLPPTPPQASVTCIITAIRNSNARDRDATTIRYTVGVSCHRFATAHAKSHLLLLAA